VKRKPEFAFSHKLIEQREIAIIGAFRKDWPQISHLVS
jgi:hypothetical protein